MLRKIAIAAVTTLMMAPGAALAAGGTAHIEDIAFSFEGPFGKYDKHQLQRGLQVFTEVCSACHGLKFVPIRTLADEGGPELPEDQVRAYAATLSVIDKETGEERAAIPADKFPANTGAGAPDLSLMAKARAGFHGPYGLGINQFVKGIGGPEYIHAILTGYSGEEKEEAGSTFYENHAFPGGWIKMNPPLSDDQVTYEDGTPATVDQMSRDVSAFLMWTAEPKLMDRKHMGFVAVLFLIGLSALLYLTNKKIWAGVKGKKLV
ncbi:cytochrome c1 [Gemmobacter caeruleus]|uniref:cytochrome c1 n=1 Tax=Gemmobacter caeruleus TaxID=2595004 RepID=UPI0011EBF9BB|nr:cytochrome c1 [Gemmobacter caeruleus]